MAEVSTEGCGQVQLDPIAVLEPALLRFRAPQSLTDASFARLKQSVAHCGGNVQPIKVRPDEAGRYELVFGWRRLQACRELGLPVAAVIQAMSAVQQVMELDASNHGEEASVYERGCLYQTALNAGFFPSRRRLAEALGRPLSDVIGATTLAELPKEVLGLLRDPRELTIAAAKRLATAVAADPDGASVRLRAAALHRGMRVREVVQALCPQA